MTTPINQTTMNSDGTSVAAILPRNHRLRRARHRDSDNNDRRPKPSASVTNIVGFKSSWFPTACLLAVAVLTWTSIDLVPLNDYSNNRRWLEELPASSSSEAPIFDQDNQESSSSFTEDNVIDVMSSSEIEQNVALNRLLVEGMGQDEMKTITDLPDYDTSSEEPPPSKTSVSSTPQPTTYESLIASSQPLPKYTLSSLLTQLQHFSNTFTVLIYDPPTDEFYALYSKKHHWASSNEKLIKALASVTYFIRKQFPQYLTENAHELAIGISSGDYPAVKITDCVRYNSGVAFGSEERQLGRNKKGVSCVEEGEGVAPILHFGSTFRHVVFPNMIAMPMPETHHLKCYERFATNGAVCSERKRLSRIGDNGLFQDPITGESKRFDWSSPMWDGLIPQVVWRGTDFMYLQTLYPELGRPSLDSHIVPHLDRVSTIDLKKQGIEALESAKTGLVPRWKGVLHTAEAELELQQLIEKQGRSDHEKKRMLQEMLPWCNIKFSHFVNDKGVKSKAKGSKEYRMWERMDFPAAGESFGMDELAKFKYHIDLGGGGGTTWSGTIQKLALPGLLFHHVTPTQDYIHRYMRPWKHYIPVAPDLRDLKAKFDWAEKHPNQARTIAQAGTRLARYWSSEKGMKALLTKDIEEPMRAVLDAYVPVSKTEYKGKSWRKIIMEIEGEGMMLPILKCTGKSGHSCERMVGKGGFFDPAQIRRMENTVN